MPNGRGVGAISKNWHGMKTLRLRQKPLYFYMQVSFDNNKKKEGVENEHQSTKGMDEE